MSTYLTKLADFDGLSKLFMVRNESINFKHILTEVFVRKSVEINKLLDIVDMDVFQYMEYMTNRLRKIYNFPREITVKPENALRSDRNHFFPTAELYKDLKYALALDFDGVVTEKNFAELYKLCLERFPKVFIVSANPTITKEWFLKRGLELPFKIHSMRGKKEKLKKLIELHKHFDYLFYVDNEPMYLSVAWIFGISTWHYRNKKIRPFSENT